MAPNSNPTIVMLQAEAGFISKHNAIPSRCPCVPLIELLAAQMHVVSRKKVKKQWMSYEHSTVLQMASNNTRSQEMMRNGLNLCYDS
ncbi:hypothetical protein TNCV_744061 [Trichonephila clavipes]|nr:hypothetical protein TNCV_744061 [Trichonephila clavipes]